MALKTEVGAASNGSVGSYDASDITVLEGLDPVRARPGMYIGSTGPSGLHHLVWEVVDNSVDEAMAGYCTQIDVTLLADGGCRVKDNGRGIPVEPQRSSTPALRGRAGAHHPARGGQVRGRRVQGVGGLHGVGVSVVNALSSKLVLEIDRGGKHYVAEFAGGGERKKKLKSTGPAPRTGRATPAPARR